MNHQGEQYPRCDCHACTQARYRMSLQGQLDQAMSRPLAVPQMATSIEQQMQNKANQ